VELKKLKRFTTATFALWPFDPEKDSKRIHNKLVILGLNPSGKIKFGTNFATQRGYGGRYDEWYREGFARPPFAGAYMTDLMSHVEAKSGKALEQWKNVEFKQRCIKDLKNQFKILGVDDSTPIMCIGKTTQDLFRPEFPNFKHVFKINHPNWYRMKNKRNIFLNDLKKVREQMSFV